MIVHVTQYRVILQKNKHHFGKYRELQKCFHGTLHPIALYFMVLHVYSCKRIAWFCSVHWTVSSDNWITLFKWSWLTLVTRNKNVKVKNFCRSWKLNFYRQNHFYVWMNAIQNLILCLTGPKTSEKMWEFFLKWATLPVPIKSLIIIIMINLLKI